MENRLILKTLWRTSASRGSSLGFWYKNHRGATSALNGWKYMYSSINIVHLEIPIKDTSVNLWIYDSKKIELIYGLPF